MNKWKSFCRMPLVKFNQFKINHLRKSLLRYLSLIMGLIPQIILLGMFKMPLIVIITREAMIRIIKTIIYKIKMIHLLVQEMHLLIKNMTDLRQWILLTMILKVLEEVEYLISLDIYLELLQVKGYANNKWDRKLWKNKHKKLWIS